MTDLHLAKYLVVDIQHPLPVRLEGDPCISGHYRPS